MYVCSVSSGTDRHEVKIEDTLSEFQFFLQIFLQSILKEWSKKFGFGANDQVGRVHMQGILLTRHCQVEVISIIKENPQEEEQVIVELDIL